MDALTLALVKKYAGGGAKEQEFSTVLENDVYKIDITHDNNGNPLNFTKYFNVFFRGKHIFVDTTNTNFYLRYNDITAVNENNFYHYGSTSRGDALYLSASTDPNALTTHTVSQSIVGGNVLGLGSYYAFTPPSTLTTGSVGVRSMITDKPSLVITSLYFRGRNATSYLAAGTQIVVRGC